MPMLAHPLALGRPSPCPGDTPLPSDPSLPLLAPEPKPLRGVDASPLWVLTFPLSAASKDPGARDGGAPPWGIELTSPSHSEQFNCPHTYLLQTPCKMAACAGKCTEDAGVRCRREMLRPQPWPRPRARARQHEPSMHGMRTELGVESERLLLAYGTHSRRAFANP